MKHLSRPGRLLVLLLVVGLSASACDLDLGEEEPTVTTRVDAGIDFRVCQIADEQGIDDHSYNQAIQRGVGRAATNLGVDVIYREAVTAKDLEAEVESLANRECNLIVMPEVVGDFSAVITAHPNINFAVVDVGDDPSPGLTIPNQVEIGFATSEAAFLAGYAAAAAADYGIAAIEPRGAQHDRAGLAFALGGNTYFSRHGENKPGPHILVGEKGDSQDTSAIDPQEVRTAVTEALRAADIIFPYVGEANLEALTVAQSAERAALVWSGENGCRSLPEQCGLFFTSVVNNIDNATFDVIKNAVADDFQSGTYEGTLANGGVGLAPFHDYAGRIPPDARKELVELRDSIISGEIQVP
jgi:basic membrane protein A